MKTRHTDIRKVLINHRVNRIILAIAGIAIAMLCSIALLRDMHSAEALNANVPSFWETSRLLVLDFVGIAMAWQ